MGLSWCLSVCWCVSEWCVGVSVCGCVGLCVSGCVSVSVSVCVFLGWDESGFGMNVVLG